MSTIARLESVQVRAGGKTILEQIDCEIEAGTVVAIIGESGSGKSTLLHTLNGLLTPTAGRAVVLGETLPARDICALRLRIGFAVQNAALMPHLRVFDNLTIMARLIGWSASRIQDRFEHLMELLELSISLGTHYPHQLSGGQQQRVSLGRAFMLDPELLLLDEPFSAVDPITRVGIYDRFEALMATGTRSAVIVTHNLKEAERLADRLIVIKDGRILQTGSMAQVREQPADSYIARLFAVATE